MDTDLVIQELEKIGAIKDKEEHRIRYTIKPKNKKDLKLIAEGNYPHSFALFRQFSNILNIKNKSVYHLDEHSIRWNYTPGQESISFTIIRK